jgi:membrane-bound acyltransferase YfiQ involved in biofilm formation
MEIYGFLAILNRRKWVVILTALMALLVVVAGAQWCLTGCDTRVYPQAEIRDYLRIEGHC